MSKNTIDIGVYVCALLLSVGVFLPLTTLMIVGDVSYQDIAEIEAYLVVGLAIAGIVMAVARPRFTGLAAIGVWVVLLFPAIEDLLRSDDGGLFSQVRDRAQGIMHDFAADLLPDLVSNIADLHWGGFVFLLGLIGFTIFAIAKSIQG